MAATEPLSALGLSVRPLTTDDIACGEALSAEAGWNQTADDWKHMLTHGRGWGAVEPTGRLVATAMTLPYGGRFGWVSMVLVTKAWRRRGIATAFLRRGIDSLLASGLVPGLDATEAGRQVYLPLGFQDVYPLARLEAHDALPQPPATELPGTLVRPATAADLDGIATYDAPIFGADRRALLGHLLGRAPDVAWIAERDGRVCGYCLGRDGRDADQIGPLSGDDDAVALGLCARALTARRQRRDRVYLDVAEHQDALRRYLFDAGFRRQRGFMRMILDRSEPFDRPDQVYAIAGPELC